MNNLVELGADAASGGQLLGNLMHFARVLRTAGLPIGPGTVLQAVRAVEAVGITNRDDFYWTLHAVFVNRTAQRELFDQAFHVFWRNPKILERLMSLILPELRTPLASSAQPLNRRLGDALAPERTATPDSPTDEVELDLDASLTWSDRERLQSKDFDQMSSEEVALAKQAIARLKLSVMQVPTRRFGPHPHGASIDMRASLRRTMRMGLGGIMLVRRRHRRRPPPLVVLCDVSGSMSRYSRMLLHFAHTLTGDRERVYSFVFGTRLTNVTRYLRERDVDEALARVAGAVEDWSGGTRIGHSLHEFNNTWSRRVLGQGAVVLFISDGLDRDIGAGLSDEMERLRMSSRRLIWLNPLLRYDAFEPRALGMRAILPYVDEFRPVHNIESLAELCQVLSESVRPRRLKQQQYQEAV